VSPARHYSPTQNISDSRLHKTANLPMTSLRLVDAEYELPLVMGCKTASLHRKPGGKKQTVKN